MTIEEIKQRQQERAAFIEMCNQVMGGATSRDISAFADIEFLLAEVGRLQKLTKQEKE